LVFLVVAQFLFILFYYAGVSLAAGWIGANDRKRQCYKKEKWLEMRMEEFEEYKKANNIPPLTTADIPNPNADALKKLQQDQ
jgi:hypothetical protein